MMSSGNTTPRAAGVRVPGRTRSRHEFARRPRIGEQAIRIVLVACAAISIGVTIGIIVVLGMEALSFFSGPRVGILEFLTGIVWQPEEPIWAFGIWPLLNATLLTSAIAMLIAGPIGLFVAIYLSEYASAKMRSTLKPILEILAGVPTVVYGYFAVNLVTPALRGIFGGIVEIYNTASAGIVIGILILPLIASMAEDAINAVPGSLREAAFAMGATRIETSLQVVVPAAISGIGAAFIVALSRAIGETMIVALAAGAGSKFTFNPFEGAETITGYIVRISGGDVAYGTEQYNAIFALGLVLFVITLILNVISRRIVTRFREVYE